MNIQTEILDNLNTRYVLVNKKGGTGYSIIDKLRGTMVLIDDPFINFQAIIEKMLELGVEIYSSAKELPVAVELPETKSEEFQAYIRKLYDPQGQETGAVIFILQDRAIDKAEKLRMEKYIENYAFNVLYPGEGINLYSNIENDTPSIVVIKGINNLPSAPTTIYNW